MGAVCLLGCLAHYFSNIPVRQISLYSPRFFLKKNLKTYLRVCEGLFFLKKQHPSLCKLTSSKPKVDPKNIYDRSVHYLKENIKNLTGLGISKVALWIPMWQIHAYRSRFQETDSDNTRQLWVYLFLSTEQKKMSVIFICMQFSTVENWTKPPYLNK
uniref:Uncharacterized protein n=1 Tax=Micrurus lemniscatus lemniscatus TaxID=129467 RepID=A0A2D4H8J5_MICLE